MKVKVKASIDATREQTIISEGDSSEVSGFESPRIKGVDSEDFTITAETRVDSKDFDTDEEAVEKGAEALFKALYDPGSVLREMFPDDIRDREEITVDHPRDGNLEVNISVAGDDVIYLAARKMAAELTKDSMTRTGYSVEQVLQWWSQDSDGDPHEGTYSRYVNDNVTVVDLPDRAMKTLRMYCLNEAGQTPGGEIDYDALPEPKRHTPDYEEMHPDK